MSKNINIDRNNPDPFYRYKMPRLLAKVEGKGNGIKTVIANMSEIAKALERPPTYPTKYFGCELGAQTNFDLKNDRYIVNGEHDAAKLQDILDGFIRKFVLCPGCSNPETTLTVKSKSQAINGKCKACGHAFVIDPKQKLSTFILKNPPPTESSETESKEKHEGTDSPTAGLTNGGGSDGDEKAEGNGKDSAEDEDDDWAPEPIAEQEKLTSGIGKLVIDKDLDKSMEERLDMLHQYFMKAKEDGTIMDAKKMLNEAERLELKNKAPLLLADVLFNDEVVNQIKDQRALLLRFCMGDKKAQRHLLGGIEQLIQKRKDVLLSKTAHIIKTLYDSDICEEEVILHWGEKASGKYVKKEFSKELLKIAQPVLTWLKEAEEASDDSGGDDDDVAVFDDRAGKTSALDPRTGAHAAQIGMKGSTSPKVVTDENGEDIDIDDI